MAHMQPRRHCPRVHNEGFALMTSPNALARRHALLGVGAAALALAAPSPARAQASSPKRILFVVSNPASSPANGMPIGYWLPELAHPWHVFNRLGWTMTVASPNGGQTVHDALSAPEGRFGGPLDVVSRGFAATPPLQAMMAETKPLAAMMVQDHDAIFVVGGLAPPVTFTNNTALHQLFAAFHDAGKVSAALCHGSLVLLHARGADGKLLAEGRRWTGYTNAEEDVVDRFMGVRFQPFRIEDEASRIGGTTFVQGAPYKPHAIADGRLITGQQGSSGLVTAELVVRALGAAG